jgi:hypothetical protein
VDLQQELRLQNQHILNVIGLLSYDDYIISRLAEAVTESESAPHWQFAVSIDLGATYHELDDGHKVAARHFGRMLRLVREQQMSLGHTFIFYHPTQEAMTHDINAYAEWFIPYVATNGTEIPVDVGAAKFISVACLQYLENLRITINMPMDSQGHWNFPIRAILPNGQVAQDNPLEQPIDPSAPPALGPPVLQGNWAPQRQTRTVAVAQTHQEEEAE